MQFKVFRSSQHLSKTISQWDEFVHFAASVDHASISAVNLLMRFGSAARGGPGVIAVKADAVASDIHNDPGNTWSVI